MPTGVARKWRPGLGVVVGGTLLAVLTLPLISLAVIQGLSARIGAAPAWTLAALGSVLATLTLAWLLRRLLLRPIRTLTDRADGIVRGDPAAQAPLEHYGTAEVGQLGQSVLGMAEALQARESALRAYIDHVTHELKTPLAAIRGSVELIEDTVDLPPDIANRLGQIAAAERRMEHLMDGARRIARARVPLPPGRTRLSDVQIAQPASSLKIELIGDDRFLPISRDTIQIILGHLVQNAEDAGAHHLRLTLEDSGALLVENDGPPIAAGNRDRVFDAFFTTKRDSGGTGMGLAIVDAMMAAAGGRISLQERDSGAAFRLEWPS